jgi:hypothetical protein
MKLVDTGLTKIRSVFDNSGDSKFSSQPKTSFCVQRRRGIKLALDIF